MSAGEERDEGFLTRWSRRKRQVASDEVAGSPAVVAPQSEATAEPEPEPVEPPSLDLVDKDFDVAHWLKQNVPESWKLAALRRAWESDPAIAGYENPARDYALDWNTPGGAPGYGPLSESDDVEAMVRSIFGDAPDEPAPAAAPPAEGDSVSHRLSSHDESVSGDAASQNEPGPAGDPSGTTSGLDLMEPPKIAENPVAMARIDPVALQDAGAAPLPTPARRRRGGGATPL